MMWMVRRNQMAPVVWGRSPESSKWSGQSGECDSEGGDYHVGVGAGWFGQGYSIANSIQ